jgi:hypothetical protein
MPFIKPSNRGRVLPNREAKLTTHIVELTQSTATNEVTVLEPTTLHLPALIAAAGTRAETRFLEFFAANIRNPNTRRATRAPSATSSPGARVRRA